jgi:hypothetical protein
MPSCVTREHLKDTNLSLDNMRNKNIIAPIFYKLLKENYGKENSDSHQTANSCQNDS